MKKLKRKRNPFSLYNMSSKYNESISYEELQNALIELYEISASDLRINKINNNRFLDYASDAMSDAKVPKHIITKALHWLEAGAVQKRRNPSIPKVASKDFHKINLNKYYIFDFLNNEGRQNQITKLIGSTDIYFKLEDDSLNYWEDVINIYGPFDTENKAKEAWKELFKEGYL